MENKEEIRNDYFNNNLTVREITKKYNLSMYKFYQIFDKKETRKVSEVLKGRTGRKHSEKTKKKISESLKKSHRRGEHPGWYHVNSDPNNRSYPESFFENYLKINNYFGFFIKEKMPFSKYYLDFAILDKKIDVEIDGQQHFRNEESIKHDQIRDKFLNDNGWIVYRIKWKDLCNDYDNEIKEFEEFIQSGEIKNRYYDIEEKFYKKCECGKMMNRQSKKCKSCFSKNRRIVERPPYEQLLKEIEELGYTGTGRKYGVSDNSIRKWKNYYEK